MENFFDKAVHYLGKTNPNTFVMNIGAMDGVMFDELIGYTNMYNFKGLYVEPIPYLFDKLKNNIPNDGNLFENSAISDYNGEIKMLTIDKEVIDQGLVHSCFYGMIFDKGMIFNPTFGDYMGYDGLAVLAKKGYGNFLHGNVVDMLYFPVIKGHFPNWFPVWGGEDFEFFRPIFNVADAAISGGVISILVYQKKFFKNNQMMNDENKNSIES
jgi:hypothetical protein